MANWSRRRLRRNSISPEYREELLATGIVVPLDTNKAFLPGFMKVLDELERSSDSVVAFLVATGRFSNETSAILVFPDLKTAERVRTATAFLAGDKRQSDTVRVFALDLMRMIEDATKIERFPMRIEPSEPVYSLALAGGLSSCTSFGRRHTMRILADVTGGHMKGIIEKFPRVFQKGYMAGWSEFESDEFDVDDEDAIGDRHQFAFEMGLREFGCVVEKSGADDVAILDICGCGNPLHMILCFRPQGGSLLAASIDPAVWDVDMEFCREFAEGQESLPEGAWGVMEVDIDEVDFRGSRVWNSGRINSRSTS